MVDPEAVRRRLREIDHRLMLIRALQRDGRQRFLEDVGIRAQVERHLQLALQSAIDIATHIASEEGSAVDEYGAAFEVLRSLEIIDKALAERLRRAAGLRNILVHAYLDLDPARLWDDLGSLDDLDALAASVLAYIGDR